MRIPNFGATIFPIAYSKWHPGKNKGDTWLSNIYSQDEYWRGERSIDVGSRASSAATNTSLSTIYEEINSDLTANNFEVGFESSQCSGYRIFEIVDRVSFRVTSYAHGAGLVGTEMFFAIQEPSPRVMSWKSMLTTCHYWESTITNDENTIVGYRLINIFEKLCFFQINASNGKRLATEFCRNASSADITEVGGRDRLMRLFVTKDQASLNGEYDVQISKAGILLSSDKPLSYHLDLAKKAGIRN